jgi:hypothetical protein
MLIYNYEKEFLGIDESDLKAFSLLNLAELQSQAADFADLFVKVPGFIHNFKQIHWIDYVACGESGEEQRVIIKIKDKSFFASITIKTIYLMDNPSQKAYIINLNNIRNLSASESQNLLASAEQQSIAKPIVTPKAAKPIEKQKDLPLEEKILPQAVFDPYDLHPNEVAPTIEQNIMPVAPLDIKPIEEAKEEIESSKSIEKSLPKEVHKAEQIIDNIDDKEDALFANYIYDPQIPSEDLGLPIDLIEEFVEDFIAQANSFKTNLYDSMKSGDINNLKVLAHKLKGVAANLRIEDALDALTKINLSQDLDVMRTNLDRFYKIILKLSNKRDVSIEPEAKSEIKSEIKETEDDFVLTFKDDTFNHKAKKTISDFDADTKSDIEIDDSLVPDSIELPELADDEFLRQPIKLESEIYDEDLSFLDAKIDDDTSFSDEEFLDVGALYDKKKAAHEIGLDIDSFNVLFEDYMIESRELANLITKSIQESDITKSKNAAIKLKGMSENMRVHNFDDDLEMIINADDTANLYIVGENIISMLDALSNIKG